MLLTAKFTVTKKTNAKGFTGLPLKQESVKITRTKRTMVKVVVILVTNEKIEKRPTMKKRVIRKENNPINPASSLP